VDVSKLRIILLGRPERLQQKDSKKFENNFFFRAPRKIATKRFKKV
jgi:hypothetical protein